MKQYLERARNHNAFIQEMESEYDSSRRHLANMMGVPESDMTQATIDSSIRYLMPSGLFDYRAHPRLKPPSQIYPAIKAAQFHNNGRPFHSMFYTGRTNFYQACYDIEQEFLKLKHYEDDQISRGVMQAPPEARITFTNSQWLSFKDVKLKFLEKISEQRYEALVAALEHLGSHPYSKLSEDFLNGFRVPTVSAKELMTIAPLEHDEQGRPYMSAVGQRKYCVAYVTVRGNGTGKVDINGRDLLYFQFIQDREQIMTPLKFTGLLNRVDIECRTVRKEHTLSMSEDAPPYADRELGTSAQSGAIRLGLSLALKSFVDKETVEKMRLTGLLSRDTRVVERKKWGQEGARRKFTWKKR